MRFLVDFYRARPQSYLFLCLALLITLTTGCAIPMATTPRTPTTEEIMQSWIGSHQSELIAKWGPPQETASDGKGGTILIYKFARSISPAMESLRLGMAGVAGVLQGDPYAQERERENIQRDAAQLSMTAAYRMFYVDEKGIIYLGKW